MIREVEPGRTVHDGNAGAVRLLGGKEAREPCQDRGDDRASPRSRVEPLWLINRRFGMTDPASVLGPQAQKTLDRVGACSRPGGRRTQS
jgi:hypothetical protein